MTLDEEAAFFKMVHRLVREPQNENSATETRRAQRAAYPSLQRIASFNGHTLPADAEFHEVRCFDLSSSGFSYLSPLPENAHQIVVALGSKPNLRHLSAQVVHQTPLTLVGCRFTGRVSS